MSQILIGHATGDVGGDLPEGPLRLGGHSAALGSRFLGPFLLPHRRGGVFQDGILGRIASGPDLIGDEAAGFFGG